MMRPAVVIVGLGRVGGALALNLRRAQWTVRVMRGSVRSARRARALGVPFSTEEDLRGCDLAILAVPDSAIRGVAEEVAERLGPRGALVHCAGALSLAPLAVAGRTLGRGSFHPLMAISSPRTSLAGHSVAISATPRKLAVLLRRMAKVLGLRSISVSERHRSAYHAGAVLSAGGVVALASAATAALESAGVPRSRALQALIPLMRSALDGLAARGLERSLTGPVARGDAAGIAGHLAALPPDLREIYRQLGLRSLALASKRLSPATAKAIDRELRK